MTDKDTNEALEAAKAKYPVGSRVRYVPTYGDRDEGTVSHHTGRGYVWVEWDLCGDVRNFHYESSNVYLLHPVAKPSKPNPERHKHAELIKANLHKFKYLSNGYLVWSDNFGTRAKKDTLCGYVDSHGYRQIKINGTAVLAHRIIWMMFNDSYPEQLDHIDRNRQNNKIENLRAATNTTNQHNASTRKDNTSGCTGVHKKNGKWQARIASFGKRIHLGVFELKQDAINAYKKAKEIHHG